MSGFGWARSRGNRAQPRGLRRGEWYRVLAEPGDDWVLLDVNQVEVRITREHVLVRPEPPGQWSVVQLTSEEGAVEAKKHGHANDEAHRTYLVCPSCHVRLHVSGRPTERRCDLCGRTRTVDWSDIA